MRGWLFGLICVAACYGPSIPSNVPCSPAGDCPNDQTCVAGGCVPSSGGPSSDAMGPDRDGDGVPDLTDNCPDVKNADQANEDGDRFGDACDPCPQIADDAPADTDGDGIGDVCDPNPTAHDTRWLFEGFHDGLPKWGRTEIWAPVGDAIQATSVGDSALEDAQSVTPPLTSDGRVFDNFSLTMSVVIDQLTGALNDHEIGIEVYDQVADKSVFCELDQGAGVAGALMLVDEFTKGLDMEPPVTWTTGAEYRLTVTRHAKIYTCSVVGPGVMMTASGSSEVVPRDGTSIDAWAFGMTARFNSLQVIGSP